MTEKIKLVRGDTKPQVKAVVKVADTGAIVSLAGATVRLLFRQLGSSTLQATLVGTLLTGLEDEDGNVDTSPPYNVAGAGGRVAFAWGSTDLDCEDGEYEGEIKVTFGDGTKQTVYEPLKFKVRDKFGA